ncbi:hypothetical protein BCR42DRAFT_315609 [Absidia repens]|uniref:DUF218 domain-containing protein n=1 Tax=Absidia repens TaxID=90262 RepID=A0A1X2J2V1_9FUNG|nr:hypothetical protein BCR42DRAFT_315609 [Absidia repens]
MTTPFWINDPLPSAPLARHNHAIVVTGHAMYMGPNDNELTALHDESQWILESYQHGQVNTFLNHIQKGIDMLLSDPQALLIFSGGQTRLSAGPISEGSSYWQVAQTLLKHQLSTISPSINPEDGIKLDQLRKRMIVEDYARDSYENVLFSLCRFAEMTSEYPTKLTVIGFEFKRPRFEQLHIKSIRYPLDQFDYIGIDPFELDAALIRVDDDHSHTESEAGAARQGELVNSYTPFLADLYGCHGALRQKKLDRNPYRRRSPYRSTCPILAPLLDYCPSNNIVFNGPLPWSS